MGSSINITNVKGDCWKASYFEGSKLKTVYFVSKNDASKFSLQDVLKCRCVSSADLSVKESLQVLHVGKIPKKKRFQKKMLKEALHGNPEIFAEEHF